MATIITYDGATLITIEADTSKTLKCSDKVMKTDLFISTEDKAQITYNGAVIAILDEGDGIVLKCKDKKMRSDIQIVTGSTYTEEPNEYGTTVTFSSYTEEANAHGTTVII